MNDIGLDLGEKESYFENILKKSNIIKEKYNPNKYNHFLGVLLPTEIIGFDNHNESKNKSFVAKNDLKTNKFNRKLIYYPIEILKEEIISNGEESPIEILKDESDNKKDDYYIDNKDDFKTQIKKKHKYLLEYLPTIIEDENEDDENEDGENSSAINNENKNEKIDNSSKQKILKNYLKIDSSKNLGSNKEIKGDISMKTSLKLKFSKKNYKIIIVNYFYYLAYCYFPNIIELISKPKTKFDKEITDFLK